jgi:hypothetical protein
MRYYLKSQLLILLLILVITGTTQAQAGGEIQVSANVIQLLSIENLEGLNLSDIVAGEVKTVFPNHTAEGAAVSGDERAGVFLVTFHGSFSISAQNLPTHMNGPNGTILPIEFIAGWRSSEDDPDNIQPITLVNDGTIPIIGNTGNNKIYVLIGARVSAPHDLELGMFETELTLTTYFGVD